MRKPFHRPPAKSSGVIRTSQNVHPGRRRSRRTGPCRRDPRRPGAEPGLAEAQRNGDRDAPGRHGRRGPRSVSVLLATTEPRVKGGAQSPEETTCMIALPFAAQPSCAGPAPDWRSVLGRNQRSASAGTSDRLRTAMQSILCRATVHNAEHSFLRKPAVARAHFTRRVRQVRHVGSSGRVLCSADVRAASGTPGVRAHPFARSLPGARGPSLGLQADAGAGAAPVGGGPARAPSGAPPSCAAASVATSCSRLALRSIFSQRALFRVAARAW